MLVITSIKSRLFDEYRQEIWLIYPNAHPYIRDEMSIGRRSETEKKKERFAEHVLLIDLIVERTERSLPFVSLLNIFSSIRNLLDRLAYLLLFY